MQPYTVPEPFNFVTSKDGPDERTERVRQEVERKRLEECTFAPQTNEASVDLLLARAAEQRVTGGGYYEAHARKAEGYARR